jgi:hypothetical protein
MEYTGTYKVLKTIFSQAKAEIKIPGSGVKIQNIGFKSDFPDIGFTSVSDTLISENQFFTYPVFIPEKNDSTKVILLLHGLNERSWIKYLVWAYWLAENTGSYVILFPMSFHINRSPDSWKDPREMINIMKSRTMLKGEISMSSFANVALSKRLTEDPLRFFKSGYQTATDIIKLVENIKNGHHTLIPGNCNIDIFAYSIGAFLAEIILMGNPENLFSDSKLFIFCGGSVFSNMQGSSKLIMDSLAFERVYNYYLNDFERTIKGRSPLIDFLRTSQIGMAFRSMIDLGRFRTFRENILNKLKDQIRSITLKNDTVIPSYGVVATLNTNSNHPAEIWDFQYPYSHENPFPIFNSLQCQEVDRTFEKVLCEAKKFFGEGSGSC